jgi:hypothetical protein
MDELIEAIKAQTEAINRLAESNLVLVDMIAESFADAEREPITYMDGSPAK